MADVWLADDSMLGRRVALKFLHERFAQDEQFVERFRREAQAAAGLQHPNVVGVFDRGETDGRPLDRDGVRRGRLAQGPDRPRALGRRGGRDRPPGARRGPSSRTSAGSSTATSSPRTCSSTARAAPGSSDFGIARAGASEITQTGSVLGTAQYLSPEQAQGLETSATSDIYSIGVMLYEALTGRVPFEADSPVAVALKQISETPRPPSRAQPRRCRRRSTPSSLRALAKDPLHRFQSADEFIAALDAAEVDPSGRPGARRAAVAEAPPTAEERTPWWKRPLGDCAGGARAAARRGRRVRAHPAEHGRRCRPCSTTRSRSPEAKIQEAGFEFAQRPAPTCSPDDTVTEQDPAAAAEAEEGSTVTMTVEPGPDRQRARRRRRARGGGREAARGGAAAAAEPGQALAAGRGRAGDLDRAARPAARPSASPQVTLLVSKGAEH